MENKELFNNKTKEQPAQRQPMQLGLYDATMNTTLAVWEC